MLIDRGDRELVAAAIAMGHGFGLEIVAEGVEDERQLAILDELGADFAQGYHFSRPLPETQLEAFLGLAVGD
jgi:EAL domain-containing protein (putative c-di-GMP-specific phosphodiesterase class I)